MEESIVLLGRAGLEYYDKQGVQYFVDSELYMGDPYDYAIYVDSIQQTDSDRKLTKEEKIRIAEKVFVLCKNRGMSPRLFNDGDI